VVQIRVEPVTSTESDGQYCTVLGVLCDALIKMLLALLAIEPEKVYALPDCSLVNDDDDFCVVCHRHKVVAGSTGH